jgi:hypothetical protein
MKNHIDEVEGEVVDEAPVVVGSGQSTLDFFLTSEPEADATREIEIKRLGLVFTVKAIEDEALKNCMKRAEKRQTKMEKQRGVAPERDAALMESLVIVEACVNVKKRLQSKAEAEANNKPEFADSVSLSDVALLDRWGPRPHNVVDRWLLPGERSQLADVVTDLAGYESNAVVEAGN